MYYSLSPRSQELTFNKTSEEMQPDQDEQLAQTFGTKGTETIGDKLADSTGIADKDGVEKNESTQSTNSEVTEASFIFQLCPK